MKLAFFGKSPLWNKVLNNELLEYFPKLSHIETIVTCDNYQLLENYDIVIPLLEEHVLTLYENNIIDNSIMPKKEHIKLLCCKFKFNIFINANYFQQYVPETYNNFEDIKYLQLLLKDLT